MITTQGFEIENEDWKSLNLITPRLAQKDHTIWGDAAAAEAKNRLDWVDLPKTSRELLPELDALSAWSRELGHSRFILCGMGGSSLAPEVIANYFKKDLEILDSTNPDQIAEVLKPGLANSCIIISSKSGTTIETKSQFAFLIDQVRVMGSDPKNHFVIVTDPGSELESISNTEGLKTIIANPKVGGRFSALSAFGLTPAALLGIDISLLLDDAETAADRFTEINSEPVKVASYLRRAPFPKIFDRDSIAGLGDWIEQLIGESSGKSGRGVLPVVISRSEVSAITFKKGGALSVTGSLGAQFIFWEWVTALLCFLLEVDPFNQPNVAESKERTSAILVEKSPANPEKSYEDKDLEVYGKFKGESLPQVLGAMLNQKSDYIAIMAYLSRDQGLIAELQNILQDRFQKPTTFGWGPRFLHSTGQFHKGGPASGAFLQITSKSKNDYLIPNQKYTFGELISAQALGDFQALDSRNLPILRIHFKNIEAGLKSLISALAEI